MKITALIGVLAVVLTCPVVAQETAAKADDTVESVIKDHRAAMNDLFSKLRAEKDQTKARKMYQEQNPTAKFVARMWKVVDGDLSSEAAFPGLTFILQNGKGTDTAKALAAVTKHHLGNEKLGTVVQTVSRAPAPSSFEFLSNVLEKSENHDTKGQACYALATLHMTALDYKGYLGDEETKSQMTAQFGEDTVKHILAADRETYTDKALAYFKRTAEDFADVKMGRRGALGDLAKSEIFEIENLGIGKPAPEIDGEDIDGVAFKLSDYRGKVVMLDFWGDW